MAKAAASKKPLSKTELLANIATARRAEEAVAAVIEALAAEIKKEPSSQGGRSDCVAAC